MMRIERMHEQLTWGSATTRLDVADPKKQLPVYPFNPP